MTTRRDDGEARRAAARRLGANWTELHRQEDEAARSSPVHGYVFQVLPTMVLITAGLGIGQLVSGERLALPHLLALVVASVGGAVWGGAAWVRRRRALRASRVLYVRDERPSHTRPARRGHEGGATRRRGA